MSFLFALLLTLHANAATNYAKVTIDWNARDLSQTLVLMCDDTHYKGVEVEIPGKILSPEFNVTFQGCSADWKAVKKGFTNHNSIDFTKIRLEGASSCTVHIREEVERTERARKFVLEIGDAC